MNTVESLMVNWQVWLVVMGATTVCVIVAYWRYLVQPERKIQRALKPHARESLRAILLPDGLGDAIEVDWVVQLDQGLLVIETLPISGHIFGAEHIETWTQILNGRSYKFANPLQHVFKTRDALKTWAPQAPIFPVLVFTADNDFPKGQPKYTIMLRELGDYLDSLCQQPSRLIESQLAWQSLCEHSQAISATDRVATTP